MPQGVPRKATAGFQELLGGNRECKYVQEMGEAMVINHSFTGKQPKQRKGEAERLPDTGLHCPVKANPSHWAPPAGPKQKSPVNPLPNCPVC